MSGLRARAMFSWGIWGGGASGGVGSPGNPRWRSRQPQAQALPPRLRLRQPVGRLPAELPAIRPQDTSGSDPPLCRCNYGGSEGAGAPLRTRNTGSLSLRSKSERIPPFPPAAFVWATHLIAQGLPRGRLEQRQGTQQRVEPCWPRFRQHQGNGGTSLCPLQNRPGCRPGLGFPSGSSRLTCRSISSYADGEDQHSGRQTSWDFNL